MAKGSNIYVGNSGESLSLFIFCDTRFTYLPIVYSVIIIIIIIFIIINIIIIISVFIIQNRERTFRARRPTFLDTLLQGSTLLVIGNIVDQAVKPQTNFRTTGLN